MDEETNQKVQINTELSKHVKDHQTQQQDKIKQQKPHRFSHQQSSTTQSQSKPFKNMFASSEQGIPMKVRNRRFKKLLELRTSGFFEEESIKLRHPLLYYLFVGQYDFEETHNSQQERAGQSQNQPNLLSSFLSGHLINVEYKNLLSQQMTSEVEKILEIEKNNSEQRIRQTKRMFSMERMRSNLNRNQLVSQQSWEQNQLGNHQLSINMSIEKSKFEEMGELSNRIKKHVPSEEQISQTINNLQFHPQQKDTKFKPQYHSLSDPELVTSMYQKMTIDNKLREEQKSIQQQHLIEYCEELFLEGKLSYLQEINYKEIDNSQEYDDWKQEEKDLEEKYFDEVQEQMDSNSNHYETGIQDF